MTFDGLGVLIFSGTINFACFCVVIVVVGGDRVGRSCRRHSYYLVELCFTFSLCENESLKFISPPPPPHLCQQVLETFLLRDKLKQDHLLEHRGPDAQMGSILEMCIWAPHSDLPSFTHLA